MLESERATLGLRLNQIADYYGIEPLSPTRIAIYFQALANWELHEVERAIGRHVAQRHANGRWFPTVADILNHLPRGLIPTSEETLKRLDDMKSIEAVVDNADLNSILNNWKDFIPRARVAHEDVVRRKGTAVGKQWFHQQQARIYRDQPCSFEQQEEEGNGGETS